MIRMITGTIWIGENWLVVNVHTVSATSSLALPCKTTSRKQHRHPPHLPPLCANCARSHGFPAKSELEMFELPLVFLKSVQKSALQIYDASLTHPSSLKRRKRAMLPTYTNYLVLAKNRGKYCWLPQQEARQATSQLPHQPITYRLSRPTRLMRLYHWLRHDHRSRNHSWNHNRGRNSKLTVTRSAKSGLFI